MNSLFSPQLNGHRLLRSVLRLQHFGLKDGRLAGQGPANVFLQAADIQLAAAVDIAGGTHPEPKIGLIGPVDLIVPAAATRTCKVRNLVMFESGLLENIYTA